MSHASRSPKECRFSPLHLIKLYARAPESTMYNSDMRAHHTRTSLVREANMVDNWEALAHYQTTRFTSSHSYHRQNLGIRREEWSRI